MAFAAVDSLRRAIWRLDDTLNIRMYESFELESLRYTLQRLDDKCYRGIDRSEINELEVKIAEAAWELQDVIESYQLSLGVDGRGREQHTRSFFRTTKKLREEYERVLENSCVAEEDIIDDDASAILRIHDNSTTVGLSDLSEEIIDGLLDHSSEHQVFPIWGMAGIGKTHLARYIYHHPLIVQRFQLRIWVTIGPKLRDIKNIFVDILTQIERKPRDLFKEKDEDELRDLLRDTLLDRTYLVALDDIWSLSDLDDYLGAFPVYENESRILVTTRLYDVGRGWSGSDKVWEMPFLSNEESWNLLRQNVFADKPFPIQLERAGRKIAQICEGLPLLILAVADILRGLDLTEECWNKVADKKTTTFLDAYERIYKVLVSSYDYLPKKYKACFLYMGVFRQSQEITASKLIHLWMVEDLYDDDDKTLEVILMNSLAIFCKHSSNYEFKSCKLHSAYWYVCTREATKNKLYHILDKLIDVSIERPRRLSVQNNMLFGLKEVYDSVAAASSLTRSLLFTGEDHQYPVQICFNTMLLMKVLDALAIRFYEFPNDVLNLLQLSYLSLTHNGEVPSSISKLQRLQYLILRRHHNIKLLHTDPTTCLPKQIWHLQKLVYLRIMGSKLPDPSSNVEQRGLSRLYVNADSCTEGVFRSIPNLKKLGIEIELEPEGGDDNSLRCLEHTGLLYRLESLKCVVVNPRFSSQVVAPPDHLSNLPGNLKRLSLNGLGYPWKYMSAVGSLPHLKVLKLRCSAFRGAEWKIKKGEFQRLRFLLLEDMDVVQWTIEEHLPRLRHLIVRHCYRLKMIPSIPRMLVTEVDDCPSIADPSRHKVVTNSSWNI